MAWWLWPAALAGSAFIATELAIGAFALRNPITYVVAAVLALAGVVALNRIRIAIDRDELRVDDARLPLAAISEVTVIDADARRDLLGQDSRPARVRDPAAMDSRWCPHRPGRPGGPDPVLVRELAPPG